MKIRVEMNLTPQWCEVFVRHGWRDVNWSEVGAPAASDREIMEWAKTHDHVVFTHDLDFGAILAATGAEGPSVIQVRAQDVLPSHLGQVVSRALKDYSSVLEMGSLLILDQHSLRARILPIRADQEGED